MYNPIYEEYYSHLQCQCYKINNPWTLYKQDVRVLCPVSDGITKAQSLAVTVIAQCLVEALSSEQLS